MAESRRGSCGRVMGRDRPLGITTDDLSSEEAAVVTHTLSIYFL